MLTGKKRKEPGGETHANYFRCTFSWFDRSDSCHLREHLKRYHSRKMRDQGNTFGTSILTRTALIRSRRIAPENSTDCCVLYPGSPDPSPWLAYELCSHGPAEGLHEAREESEHMDEEHPLILHDMCESLDAESDCDLCDLAMPLLEFTNTKPLV